MTADYGARLPLALRRTFGLAWDFQTDGFRLRITHRDHGTPFHPPRHTPSWPELLDRIEAGFEAAGVRKTPPLPLRWGRDTDFTISAIQAFDPYVKDRQPYVYREGYLPQPVVRFTGKRNATGALEDGFLTAFVNVSHIQRIGGVGDHAAILNGWISVLSRLGLHARHLTIAGQMAPWERGPVKGITLHIDHAGLAIGDIVLIWNAADPTYLVTDLGSGLERLRWAITRHDWQQLVHGLLAGAGPRELDAIRTATLIVASGILPSSQGRGSALRRLLRSAPTVASTLGVSRVVRQAHQYWNLVAPTLAPWHEVTTQIEIELDRTRRPMHL